MKIATLQYGPVIGRVEENIRRAGALLEEAEGSGRLNGLHLLVLPELAFAGKSSGGLLFYGSRHRFSTPQVSACLCMSSPTHFPDLKL